MKLQLILLLNIAVLLNIVHAQANIGKCNMDCLPNFVQCLTPTTYKVCINGQTFGDAQRCAEGTFCSNASSVCMPANSVEVDFVYGTENTYSGGNCGECLEDDIFTCVDQTRFTMCKNRDVYVSCNPGEYCVKGLFKLFNKICVTQNTINDLDLSYSCSHNDLIIDCIAHKSSETNFKLVNRLDLDNCRTYITCKLVGNEMNAELSICPDNTYFSYINQRCVNIKRDKCGLR